LALVIGLAVVLAVVVRANTDGDDIAIGGSDMEPAAFGMALDRLLHAPIIHPPPHPYKHKIHINVCPKSLPHRDLGHFGPPPLGFPSVQLRA